MTATASPGATRSAPPGPYDDDLLGRLLLIRHVELALLSLFAQGHAGGTTHTSIGQEYIPVALAPLIADDIVFSNHRGHAHYLALHDDAAGLLAEVLGREGAVCRGVGGSQHIYKDGRFMSTGVQGESVAVAAGVALHEARSRSSRLAVAFVGDGTWGEGVVYEALNMAALWHLPMALVVENNGMAQTTPVTLSLAGSIVGRAAAFGVRHLRLDSVDVSRIRAQVAGPLGEARHGAGPVVLEFLTERVGPHSKGDDTRSPEELAGVRERDWAARYRAAHPGQFDRIDNTARHQVAELVAGILSRPLSAWPRSADG
jgi:acetoin:2,6-dichlorophenolindophenol oxidoreductase subunit alpha